MPIFRTWNLWPDREPNFGRSVTRAPHPPRAPIESAIVIHDDQPPETLPVRGRSSLPGGRHRRPGSGDLPPDAPVLVLAVPGTVPDVGNEIAGNIRTSRTDIDIRVAAIGGPALA